MIKSTEMANWTEAELAEFERRVATKLEILDERIEEYRELTKPIPPENAIGRVSRMDAINNRSVNGRHCAQLSSKRRICCGPWIG